MFYDYMIGNSSSVDGDVDDEESKYYDSLETASAAGFDMYNDVLFRTSVPEDEEVKFSEIPSIPKFDEKVGQKRYERADSLVTAVSSIASSNCDSSYLLSTTSDTDTIDEDISYNTEETEFEDVKEVNSVNDSIRKLRIKNNSFDYEEATEDTVLNESEQYPITLRSSQMLSISADQRLEPSKCEQRNILSGNVGDDAQTDLDAALISFSTMPSNLEYRSANDGSESVSSITSSDSCRK